MREKILGKFTLILTVNFVKNCIKVKFVLSIERKYNFTNLKKTLMFFILNLISYLLTLF